MTACGGNFIGDEIRRNEQCPHEADLRRLSLRRTPPTRMLCIRGKPGNHPQGKVYFPPRIFPGFLGPEALKLFVTPARQAELVCLFQRCSFASCGSRGIIPLAQVWGRAAPSVPFASIVDSELKCPIQPFSYPISLSFPRAIFRPVFLSKSTAALWNAMLTLASTG